MIYIVYLFKIIAYFLICRLVYDISKRAYKRNGNRLTWLGLFLSSFLFAIYSIYITNPNLEISHDRKNYYERYSDYYDLSLDSFGLNYLFEQLRPISLEATFLWFSTALLFVSITLIAYKYYKQATPFSLLFMLCSIFFMFGYAAIKQSFANALACLSLMCFFNMPFLKGKGAKWLSYLLFFLFALLAILFHEAAFILIIMYLALIGWNNKFIRKLGWTFMIVFIVAFSAISSIIFGDLAMLSESLEEQTAGYADQEIGSVGNVMTIFKGFPFYAITYVGFKKRGLLVNKIVNYDRYLLLSATVSLTSLLSFFNYWYFRFGMLFYLPVFVFTACLYDNIPQRDSKKKWLRLAFLATVLLSVKELAQYYFLYGGI